MQYESYQTLNSQSQEIVQKGFYNQLSQMVLVQTQTASGSAFANQQADSYDTAGQLISQVTYQLPGNTEEGTFDGSLVSFDDGGWVKSDVVYTYNADGELTDQSTYAEEAAQTLINEYVTSSGVTSSSYATEDQEMPGMPTSVGSWSDGALLLDSEVEYNSYDADGNLISYQTSYIPQETVLNPSGTQSTDDYTNTYVWQNAALNSGTAETITSDGSTSTQSNTNTYNDLGELVATNGGVNGSSQTNYMAYTADAQLLQQTTTPTGSSSSTSVITMYANQQSLGSVNSDGAINVLATTGGFTNSTNGTQNYTVKSGDTLQSLAQEIYGDSNYGYIIAEANGLEPGSSLTVGMTLQIPQVTTTANNANTFQPSTQSAVANAGPSACETTAEIVAASIETVLNQQSAFAQTVDQAEEQESVAAAAAAAQAARLAAEKVANGAYRYEYEEIQQTLSTQASKEADLATQYAQASQQALAQGNQQAAAQAAQQSLAAAAAAQRAIQGLAAQDQPVHTDLLSDSGAVPDGVYGTDDDDNDNYYSGQLGAPSFTPAPPSVWVPPGYSLGSWGNGTSPAPTPAPVLAPAPVLPTAPVLPSAPGLGLTFNNPLPPIQVSQNIGPETITAAPLIVPSESDLNDLGSTMPTASLVSLAGSDVTDLEGGYPAGITYGSEMPLNGQAGGPMVDFWNAPEGSLMGVVNNANSSGISTTTYAGQTNFTAAQQDDINNDLVAPAGTDGTIWPAYVDANGIVEPVGVPETVNGNPVTVDGRDVENILGPSVTADVNAPYGLVDPDIAVTFTAPDLAPPPSPNLYTYSSPGGDQAISYASISDSMPLWTFNSGGSLQDPYTPGSALNPQPDLTLPQESTPSVIDPLTGEYGPMPTVEDSTPSLLARQDQQAQLNKLGMFLFFSSLPSYASKMEAPEFGPGPYAEPYEPSGPNVSSVDSGTEVAPTNPDEPNPADAVNPSPADVSATVPNGVTANSITLDGSSVLSKSELNQLSSSQVNEYLQGVVNNLNVTTTENQAVFYSGSGAGASAQDFAAANGKLTIEMTPGGGWLNDLDLFNGGVSGVSQSQAQNLWIQASSNYANGASGSVVGILNNPNPLGIFNTVEYPLLQANPSVTNVITGGK
ncbi:LysM peptidoglycan-binding domain-containing protein [Dyella flava]|uniref:LysM peptidoglycan-binding domain-containing protein n=1 Tax=Dyella flava TaxID=1920170 RepID=A0ABS2K9M3_9GAMM|nr:LysM peptidoglycan-binding domain-containing protein [Dyella flava]MBM7127745.1 LysM peptidoglycan-binding domain-containing protein [Dyella flava]